MENNKLKYTAIPILILLLSLALSTYGQKYYDPPIITIPQITIITTTTTTTTTLPECPDGCECLTEAHAEKYYQNPEKCIKEVCGYTYSDRAVAMIQIPMYCYREEATSLPVQTTVTTLPPVQMPALLPEGSVGCNSCIGCTNALKSNDYVVLTSDIENRDSTCIMMTELNDRILDCRNFKIEGFGIGIEFYSGIELSGSDDNEIRNCYIAGFGSGIATYSSNRNTFINNTITLNDAGIWLGGGLINNATREVIDGSNDNEILKNNITGNNLQGIYLVGNKNTKIEENRICQNSVADIYGSIYSSSTGNTRDDNVCDLIFNWNNDDDMTWCDTTCTADVSTTVNSGAGLADALAGGEYGTVELTGNVHVDDGLSVGASHVTLECNGHRIMGSGLGIGVEIRNKVNIEVRDCIIEDFLTGLLMESVSHSRILSNEIKDNNDGLVMRSGYMNCRGNTIDDNKIKPNDVYGIFMSGRVYENTFTDNELLGSRWSLYTLANCNNEIDETNIGGNMKKIGYFHDTSGLNIDHTWGDRDFSALILCNVRNSEFHGISVNNGAAESDGVLIRNSQNVDFIVNAVTNAYQGFMISNSSNILLQQNSIGHLQEDCITVSLSSDVQIEQGTIGICDTGISLFSTTGAEIRNINFEELNQGAIKLDRSTSTLIDENYITGSGAPGGMKGITLTESSTGNTITDNEITKTAEGVGMCETCISNRLEDNEICNNTRDIHNSGGESNTGIYNRCSVPIAFSDEGTKGCTYCCEPAINDLDGDGIDNACDCADIYQSYGETGVDCGGKCPECVECTWCDSKIEPLRIRGGPNSGYMDVVFVPGVDWGGDRSGFLNVVKDTVRAKFLELDAISTEPIFAGYEDYFNFYAYYGSGRTTDESNSCYNPEGPEGWLCIGCKGWLPGEESYYEWVVACSLTCALSLGLGCGCFAYEPDHFWQHASFADSAGIIMKNNVRGCSGFGPTSHFTAAYCSNRGNVIAHEFAHSMFALTDEYCGDTAYSRASNVPNVWNSMSDCESTAAAEGWDNGTCAQIRVLNSTDNSTICSKDKYRYDTDIGHQDMMSSGCGSGGTPMYKEADIRRINYVFDHWPSGGSKGIISYIIYSGGEMKSVMSRVVPNHPDLGNWASDFTGVTETNNGEEIDVFTFSDPRKNNIGRGAGDEPVEPVYTEDTMFTLIVPMHEDVRWLNVFNGSSGDLEVTIDLGPAIWNYCEENEWLDEYCETLDIDNNGIPDIQEVDDWIPEERIIAKVFEDRPDLKIDIKDIVEWEYAPPETEEQMPEEEGGDSLTQYLFLGLGAVIALLFAIIILLTVMVLRKE